MNLKIHIWPSKSTSSTKALRHLCVYIQRCMCKVFTLVLFITEKILVRITIGRCNNEAQQVLSGSRNIYFSLAQSSRKTVQISRATLLLVAIQGPISFQDAALSSSSMAIISMLKAESTPRPYCSWCGRGRDDRAGRHTA